MALARSGAGYSLKVAGSKAKDACRNAQISTGLETGIEGAVHAVRSLWEDVAEMEEWGFLLVDAEHVFNTDNHITTCWKTRYKWTSGAQFSHNYYCIQTILLIHVEDGYDAYFLISCEGVIHSQ